MERKETLRFIPGYIFGITVFMFIIPALIFCAAYFSAPVFQSFLFDDDRIGALLALLFCIPGTVFMVWSNMVLFKTGKGGPAEGFGIEISPKTKFLVTDGPYRYTRNPMVFGAFCMYLSLVFIYNSWGSLLLVILFLPVAILYLKKSEEKRMVRDFGEDYIMYRDRVPLFFPLPPKR